MTGKTITVHVEPGSELDRALAEAGDREIVLERNGKRYRVEPAPHFDIADSDNIWAAYDPEVVLRSLDEFGGAWSDIDAEALKEYIYRGREEGTRPDDHPSQPPDRP
jgi:hypothetical protein